MNRVIFINQVTGPLLIDILNVYAKKDCEVILYTGLVTKTYAELSDSVKTRKLCSYRRNNSLNRLLTWFVFFIQTIVWLIYDLKLSTRIYFSSNPPVLPFISCLFKNKFDIHVYDVYPDALLASKYITKRSSLYKLFSYLNRLAYSNAENIFTPSMGMKHMLKEYVSESKIVVIPWWADTDYIKPISKDNNKFIAEHNLQDKFIVLYSGNFGFTHNIEKFLDTALSLSDKAEIMFVIIGDGPKKTIVDDFMKKNALNNLLVLPFQDEKMLPYSLAAGDISVILDSFSYHDKNVSTASIPSKTYYLMAAGSAILAVADKDSELSRLVTTYDIGTTDYNQDNHRMIEFINYCFDNKQELVKFKENSRKTSGRFTKENAEFIYQSMFNS
jgi:glycosyltransferase involved in cell wall biosynthesis